MLCTIQYRVSAVYSNHHIRTPPLLLAVPFTRIATRYTLFTGCGSLNDDDDDFVFFFSLSRCCLGVLHSEHGPVVVHDDQHDDSGIGWFRESTALQRLDTARTLGRWTRFVHVHDCELCLYTESL